MARNVYGLDLGTYDIKIFDKKKDRIWHAKNVIAMKDKKYDLMKHPNIRLTEDGGAEAYDYAKAPLAHDTFAFDAGRYEDYELLSDEDIIGGQFPI